MHIGTTWRIRLDRPCAAPMRPFCQITLTVCSTNSQNVALHHNAAIGIYGCGQSFRSAVATRNCAFYHLQHSQEAADSKWILYPGEYRVASSSIRLSHSNSSSRSQQTDCALRHIEIGFSRFKLKAEGLPILHVINFMF